MSAARAKVPKGVAFLVRYINSPTAGGEKVLSQSPSAGARNVKTITVVVRAQLRTVPIRSVLEGLPSAKPVRIRSHSYPDGFTAQLPLTRSIRPGVAKFDAMIWVPEGGSRQQVVIRDGKRVALRITLTPGVERKVSIPILAGLRFSIEASSPNVSQSIYVADAKFTVVKS